MANGIIRRSVLKGATAAVAAPYLAVKSHPVIAAGGARYPARVIDLVEGSLVIDMLALLIIEFGLSDFSRPLTDQEKADFIKTGVSGWHVSDGINGPTAREEVLKFIAQWSGFAGRNSDVFSLVGRMADLERAKREGKVGVIIGLQNSDHFDTTDDVALFYSMGQRCSQLTYNSQNRLGSGSTEREDGGLTDYGADIIAAMNAVGMLVDVSHCGDRTTLDAIAASPRPIAVTHSNCRALNNHPRLKTDEAIRALAAKGGVMGITGVRMFVRDREPTTVEHIVDHIDHVVKLVGIDHVGIGSDGDLYGFEHLSPKFKKDLHATYKASYAFRAKDDTDDFAGPQKIYNLTHALVRRGYTDPHIRAILGGNFKRLLSQTWR